MTIEAIAALAESVLRSSDVFFGDGVHVAFDINRCRTALHRTVLD